MTEQIKKIYEQFECSGKFVSAQPYGSGHINNTYLVKVDEEAEYILQRLNTNVFKDIPKLMQNKERVCQHIRNKLLRSGVGDITRRYITYYHTAKGKPYYKDYDGNYWTLSLFIKGSRSYDVIPNAEIAYQVEKEYGYSPEEIFSSVFYIFIPFSFFVYVYWKNFIFFSIDIFKY